MPIVVTPVLSSTAGYVVDVRDQVAALIRTVVMNPGWTSSIWQDRLVSFRTAASKYEQDRRDFALYMQHQVETVLSRMFADYNFDCDFTTEDYDPNQESASYTIKFNILINDFETSDKEPALIVGAITVDPNTNDINVIFDTKQNSIML